MTKVEADIIGVPLSEDMMLTLKRFPQIVIDTIEQIQSHGHGAWLVGGCVRDLVSSVSSQDFDVTTSATPQEILELFGANAVPTGLEFGTITLKTNPKIEITTLRTEAGYQDLRHPDEVHWGTSLRDDLSRRDFTMNAMAIDPVSSMLFDPFGGRIDMKKNILKGVGNPHLRCKEDALRVLRAFRFLSSNPQRMLHLDDELRRAIEMNAKNISALSAERIWNELKRIFSHRHLKEILRLMADTNVFQTIFSRHNPPSYSACISTVNAKLTSPQILAFLLIESPFTGIQAYEDELRLSKQERKEFHRFHKLLSSPPVPTFSGLRLFHHFAGKETETILKLQQCLSDEEVLLVHKIKISPDDARRNLELLNDPALNLIEHEPLLNGSDIMAATSIHQGERVGRLKEWMFKIQIEMNILTKQEMLVHLASCDWEYIETDDMPDLQIPIRT